MAYKELIELLRDESNCDVLDYIDDAATNCHESVRLFRYMWNGMMQGKSVAEGSIMKGDKRKTKSEFILPRSQ